MFSPRVLFSPQAGTAGQGTVRAVSRVVLGSCGKEEPGLHQGRVTEVFAGQAPAQALPPSSALPSSPCFPLPWAFVLLLDNSCPRPL